ncbi:MAG: bifunctional diaminohydroxyphosphoribosylaminopyrimidine deaminase/5-amino-6-(5-phosphoribosylamino)uracil reductase RibD [Candidatus Velthaea sp.]
MEGRRGQAIAADAAYLGRARELALRAIADAAPNPPVGAVLVRDGRTLGEGYHHRRGLPHAEVEALRAAAADGADVRGATAYVSLEPCNHHGRTPPCTQALIAAGIARVVVGAMDPNPRTAGGGVATLRAAGIDVEVVDDAASRTLVERFAYTIVQPERPFVTLKMAMSLDGAIAPRPGRYWLTGEAVRERVAGLRFEHDAVMVGAGTVRIDDPQLTVRPHRTRYKPYTRVIVCESDTVPAASRVFAVPAAAPPEAYARTIVLAPAGARERFSNLKGVADVIFAGRENERTLDLRAALAALRDREITAVLCEGGPTLAGRLLAQGLVQRATWFVAPRFIQSPDAVPPLAGADLTAISNGWTFDQIERVGDDVMLSARVNHV